MNPYALPDLIAFIVSGAFGVFVYRKNPGVLLNRVFGILMISICLWQFCEFALVNAEAANSALLWNRLVYLGLIPTPTLAFIFALVNAKSRFLLKGTTGVLPICLPALVLLLLVPTDLFVAGVQREYWGFGKIAGPYYPYFSVYFSLFIFLTLVTFYYASKTAQTAMERIQSKYLLAAIALPGIIGIFILAILQPLKLNYLNTTVAPFATIVGTAIVTYAIVKHRLMHIDLVLKKGTTYLLLTLIIFLPAVALMLWGQKFFFNKVHVLFSVMIFVTFFTLAYFFEKIKPRTEKVVEHLLFKDRYNYRETLGRFSKALVTILDLQALSEKIIETTTQTMGVEKASFWILNEEKGGYELIASRNLSRPIPPLLSRGDALPDYLQKLGEIVVREELIKGKSLQELNQVTGQMSALEAEVSIPLIWKHQLLGIINLSHKFNKDIYSHEDIELLATLGNQAAIAIENARLYEDLKKSKSYIRRADRLASLGTLTAGLAHEIRNPLVAIKTFTQLLPERLEDEEFRNHFLNIASGEVDRISSLVTELLEFARPSEPKLEIEDINTILDGMILLISTETKSKHIEIVKHYATDLPPVTLDREQMKQVFLNILLNAIEATPENGKISVKTRSFLRPEGDRFVQVEFTDTGCGIPAEHLEEIFTPFFTTKDKGSGLGLSISNQIVQDHRGYIAVESRVRAGTSFFVNLPADQNFPRRRKSDLKSDQRVTKPLEHR